MHSKAETRRPATRVQIHRITAQGEAALQTQPDEVVTEEPMEIRVAGPGQRPEALAVTMRTPGHDFELAAGFCRTEGLIHSVADVNEIRYCLDARDDQEYNIVTVRLRAPVDLDARRRSFIANSSCGLCGVTSIDQGVSDVPPGADGPIIGRSWLLSLPERARQAQSVFDATGGLHAAALFDAEGNMVLVREDIGRHNALDKIVGHALLQDMLPLENSVVLVSGRVSFEIVQKAAVAGIGIAAAVSAPSSLAIRAAERLNQTLVGFLREGRGNIYTHPGRIDMAR